MTVIEQAQAIREAMDVAGATLTDEQALVCVRLYKAWEADKKYAVGDFLTYGVNGVGDPQLYKVVQAHTSQKDWTPDTIPALYDALGLDDSGYPIWAQPTGAHDAYNAGDIVNYNGTLYESKINGNTYVPGTDERWWTVVE
jgi:chitodextrinase